MATLPAAVDSSPVTALFLPQHTSPTPAAHEALGTTTATKSGGHGTGPPRIPPVPWRDPHTVSPARLTAYIESLEKACADHPDSADLRTCLGMAHAMNFEAYKAMDALEAARRVDPSSFFAQLKYAELHYRLRALPYAEAETLRALELAGNSWEASLARKQLQEIRARIREGTQKPEWNKPLAAPVLTLIVLAVLLSCALFWLR